jgi:alkane 1-monooxygenase
MEIRDLKYLLAYVVPISAMISIWQGGIMSYFTVVVAFVLIPVIEVLLPVDKQNLSEEEADKKKHAVFFDVLLYLNLVWVYGIISFLFYTVYQGNLYTYEWTGMLLSTGIMLGSNGINVAHELGHKSAFLPRLASKILLIPSLYMHFFIEHNRGHHLRVATPDDPATSRYNEPVFTFWFRSVTGGWMSAWNIEKSDLLRQQKKVFSADNQMILFTCIELSWLLLVFFLLGWKILLSAIIIALISVLLLESINYIEHYGLTRNKNKEGKYERVETIHSWNSDHEVGRILLYELTRHSDHHYKASKKYQILDHYDESPQLPFGYPTSILLALIPPLWFSIMNPRVADWQKSHGVLVSP